MKRGKVYGKSEEGDWQYDCCVPGGRNERFFFAFALGGLLAWEFFV